MVLCSMVKAEHPGKGLALPWVVRMILRPDVHRPLHLVRVARYATYGAAGCCRPYPVVATIDDTRHRYPATFIG